MCTEGGGGGRGTGGEGVRGPEIINNFSIKICLVDYFSVPAYYWLVYSQLLGAIL